MPNVLYNRVRDQLLEYLDEILALGILKRSLEITGLNPDLVSSRQMHRAMEEHIYPSIRTFLSPEDFNVLKKKLEKIMRESSW